MAFFNYATMQMAAKIVYYGPGLCGKTTNLQYVFNKTSPKSRGEMVSLETESDRTLFFDLLPLEVGIIAGFKTRFQLYTVPGQVFYGETRRMVLKGVDGVVFVADSQQPMREANIESLKDLSNNLKAMGVNLKDIPLVFQYNKRDLPNLLSIEELEKSLNWYRCPSFESSALKGMGVFETLKGISKITLQNLRSKLVQPSEAVVAQPMSGRRTRFKQRSAPAAPKVTFATRKTRVSNQQLARTTPAVKTVTTTGLRVASEIDRIRESLLTPLVTSKRPQVKDLSPTLDNLRKETMVSSAPVEFPVEVPPSLLEDLQEIRLEVQVGKAGSKKETKKIMKLSGARTHGRKGEWLVRIKLSPKKT